LAKTPKRRRSSSSALRGAATAFKAGEAVSAAAAVIAARTELAALHATRPTVESAAEMGLMVTEKMQAFGQSGVAVASGAADLAGRGARYVAQEAQEAGKALTQFSACRTPAEFFAVQARLMTGLLGRAYAHGVSVHSVATRTGEKALAPVHKAVTANKRRLDRS
jgi:hypothetical protein